MDGPRDSLSERTGMLQAQGGDYTSIGGLGDDGRGRCGGDVASLCRHLSRSEQDVDIYEIGIY